MGLATADEIVVWVRMLTGDHIEECTVAQWATRRLIGRHGRRGRRTLYSLDEVQQLLEARAAAA